MIELARSSHFDFSSREYRELLAHSRTTAFQRPEWLTPFYRHLASSSATQGWIVCGRSGDDGTLQLVLPLVRRTDGRTVVIEYAHADVTDYACPVLHSSLFSDSRQMSDLRDRLHTVLGPHDLLRITPVRETDRDLWEALLQAPATSLPFGRHEVTPELPFEAWRDRNLGPARRRQLDRKSRRLRDRGECALEVLPPDRASDALTWAAESRRGRFADDPIQRPETLRFYREVAATDAGSGFAHTYRLRCGSDTIGVCFGIIDGSRFSYLVLACDYQRYGRYSPGSILLDQAMADWIGNGGTTFDFTIGDEAYKSAFRCIRRPMIRFDIQSAR